jgi:hypothetical protein
MLSLCRIYELYKKLSVPYIIEVKNLLKALNNGVGMAIMEWREGAGVDGSFIDWLMLSRWISKIH